MDELFTGWLSPAGELHKCDSWNHVEKAREIVDSYRYQTITHRSVDDCLMAHGWVYIGISTFLCHEWRIVWEKFLTPYQINFLKPYFEEPVLPVNSVARMRWEREVEEE